MPRLGCGIRKHAILLPMLAQLAYQAVLFDLDGTLTDPAEGITRCMAYGLEQVHAAVPALEVLRSWIGPPLRASFAAYLQDAVLAEQVLYGYRERFSAVGIFENQVYDGIPELLAELHSSGCRLFLATSKPQLYAERILEHFDLRRYFAVVGGASLDDRMGTKAEVIGALLPSMSDEERGACVMVGDRDVDVEGARAHGIACIAVNWGFGSLVELESCKPARIVHRVAELRDVLMSSAIT